MKPVPFPSEKVVLSNANIVKLSTLSDEISNLQEQLIATTKSKQSFLKNTLDLKWLELDKIVEQLYELDENEKQIINSYGRTVSRTDKILELKTRV